jgi:hypothetical protein
MATLYRKTEYRFVKNFWAYGLMLALAAAPAHAQGVGALPSSATPSRQRRTLAAQETRIGTKPVNTRAQIGSRISGDYAQIAWVESEDVPGASKRSRSRVVRNGKPGAWYDGVDRVAFSPDGKKFAYLARQGDKALLVENDVVTRTVSGIPGDILEYWPDSSGLLYCLVENTRSEAAANRKTALYRDGKLLKTADAMLEVIWSSDGGSFVLHYRNKGLEYVGGPSGETAGAINVKNLTWASASRHYAYQVRREDGWHVVLDGVEGKEAYNTIFPVLPDNHMGLKPDGTQMWFPADQDGRPVFVVDGKSSPNPNHISAVLWSGDSKEAALLLGMDDGGAVSRVGARVDKKAKLDTFLAIDPLSMAYSPDSRHMAYIGITDVVKDLTPRKRSTSAVLVMDGKASAPFLSESMDVIMAFGRPVVFSPDSNRFAYEQRNAEWQRRVVIGSVLSGPGAVLVPPDPYFDSIGIGHSSTIVFSPDTWHWAYMAKRGDKVCLVVDGRETAGYDDWYSDETRPMGRPVWDDARHVRVVAYRGTEAYRVTATVP